MDCGFRALRVKGAPRWRSRCLWRSRRRQRRLSPPPPPSPASSTVPCPPSPSARLSAGPGQGKPPPIKLPRACCRALSTKGSTWGLPPASRATEEGTTLSCPLSPCVPLATLCSVTNRFSWLLDCVSEVHRKMRPHHDYTRSPVYPNVHLSECPSVRLSKSGRKRHQTIHLGAERFSGRKRQKGSAPQMPATSPWTASLPGWQSPAPAPATTPL
jgi:hypothetical protein